MYMTGTIVYGTILLPVTSLQWIYERKHEAVGMVPKMIHRMFTTASVAFVGGWIFNGIIQYSWQAFIAAFLVDLVTVCLVATMWMVGYGIVYSVYRAGNLVFPLFPRFLFYVMTIGSILSAFVINVVCFIYDRQWPRFYFYLWLALNFASALGLLWALTWRLLTIIGPDKIHVLRRFRCIVALATILVFIAVALQIEDAIAAISNTQQNLIDQQSTQTAIYGFVFLNLQGLAMLIGTWYGWIDMGVCTKERMLIDAPPSTSLLDEPSTLND